MKLIEPHFEIKEQESGLSGIYKQIEWAGRHCYKSLDKITEDSAKEFVDRMIKSGHGSMLEHGTVYLKVLLNNELVLEDAYGENNDVSAYNRYINNKYSKVNYRDGLENIFTTDTVEPGYAYITTNLRVLVENNWIDDLKYLCEPTEHHERIVTVKLVCSRSVSHQVVRHRTMSFSQESQRYCNYSLDKFNNEITFIKPYWLTDYQDIDNNSHPDFVYSLVYAEARYFDLLEQGLKPQQARSVLPNATKTEIVISGFLTYWENLFKLRCGAGADPEIKQLMIPLEQEFKNKFYNV